MLGPDPRRGERLVDAPRPPRARVAALGLALILDRVADERGQRLPGGRDALAADDPVDEHEVRRAGHAVVLPRLRGHHDRDARRGERAQPRGRSRSAPRVTITVCTPAGSRRSPSVSQKPGAGACSRWSGTRAASERRRAVERERRRRRRPASRPRSAAGAARRRRAPSPAAAAVAGRPGLARRRTESPQDLGVAAQQARDEHDQQHEQHRLDRHQIAAIRRRHLPAAGRPGPPGSRPRACRCCRRSSRCRCSSAGDRRRVLADHQPAHDLGRAAAPGCCTGRSGSGCSRRAACRSRPSRTGSRRGRRAPGVRLQSM